MHLNIATIILCYLSPFSGTFMAFVLCLFSVCEMEKQLFLFQAGSFNVFKHHLMNIKTLRARDVRGRGRAGGVERLELNKAVRWNLEFLSIISITDPNCDEGWNTFYFAISLYFSFSLKQHYLLSCSIFLQFMMTTCVFTIIQCI